MEYAHSIAQHYLNAWNERDAAARRSLVGALFAPHARYLDPMMQGAGHEGIDALIAGAQQHFPDHRFELAGTPDGHNDVLRFSWTLVGPEGKVAARGSDVAALSSDGRLASVTGFLDFVA